MESRPHRIGDVLDDYCPRCRLLLNHAVVGMVAEEVKKVRCQTCLNEHPYRHGRLPKRRKTKETLFRQVLDKVVQEGKVPAESGAGGNPPGKGKMIKAGMKAEEEAGIPPEEEDASQDGTAAEVEAEDRESESGMPLRKPRSHSLAAQLGVKRQRPTEPVSPSVRQQREARKGPPQRGQRPGGRGGGPPGRGPRQGPRNRRGQQQGGVDPHQWMQPGKLHFGKNNMGRNNKKRGRG